MMEPRIGRVRVVLRSLGDEEPAPASLFRRPDDGFGFETFRRDGKVPDGGRR